MGALSYRSGRKPPPDPARPEQRDGQLADDLFYRAAQVGDRAEVRRLIEAGESVDRFDDLGHTPLHYAAAEGYLGVMRDLLEAGANVNARDERVISNTPSREVAQSCTFETASLLIEHGADPTVPGWMQLTALDVSGQRKREQGRRVHELLPRAAAGHEA